MTLHLNVKVSRRVVLGASAAAWLSACSDNTTPTPGGSVQRFPYGDDPSQWADLYPAKGTSRGVVVVIHGGFWRAQYDASLGAPLAVDLAARGWTAWNLEYRRVGNGGGLPATFEDVAAGINLLATTAVDTSTVVTLGHSAGGHLATWAAARGEYDWPDEVPVTHVVSQAGVLDLTAAYEQDLGGGAVAALLGIAPGPEYDRVDPQRQLPLDQPVWVVQSQDDGIIPFSQATGYVDAAAAAGAKVELVEVGGDHFAVIDPSSAAWASIIGVLDGIA